MKVEPKQLAPNLKNHLSLWLPRVFAPIHERLKGVGERALQEAKDAKATRAPICEAAVNDRGIISLTALSRESTGIFCSRYAHLFICDVDALNDLASERHNSLDHLLIRVTEFIPQPPLSSDEIQTGAIELSYSEKEVMERMQWPDRKFAEQMLMDSAMNYAEDWENFESQKEGYRRAEERWHERNEDLYVARWWALILDYRDTFIEAMAQAVASSQKARSTPSKAAPSPDRVPVELASRPVEGDSIEEQIRRKPSHTRSGLAKILGLSRQTIGQRAKEHGVVPRRSIPQPVALAMYWGEDS